MVNEPVEKTKECNNEENDSFLIKYTILMFIRLLLTIGPPVVTLIVLYCISPQRADLFPLTIPLFLGWTLYVIIRLLRPLERWTFNES